MEELNQYPVGMGNNLYTNVDVLHNSNEISWEGKILLLDPEMLGVPFRNREHQLWRAVNGDGCTPGNDEGQILAYQLSDGSRSTWKRSDFLGVSTNQNVVSKYEIRINDEERRLTEVLHRALLALHSVQALARELQREKIVTWATTNMNLISNNDFNL